MESYTEGWAAAMVAVAMSMENAGGDNVLAALSQSSRDIEEYLHDEVLSTWRPERLAFALKTSILDTLTPAFCRAVTAEVNRRRPAQGNQSGQRLPELFSRAGANLSIPPLV